jgi:hypothetical protein
MSERGRCKPAHLAVLGRDLLGFRTRPWSSGEQASRVIDSGVNANSVKVEVR